MKIIDLDSDYMDRRDLLANEAVKELLNRQRSKLIDKQVQRRRNLKELRHTNMKEFFRLIGACEKE